MAEMQEKESSTEITASSGEDAGSKALSVSVPVVSGSGGFSQLLAGAMASPVVANSPLVVVPVVAVPCFVAPAGLIGSSSSSSSSGFTGQFGMTHQAVLATVTAQARMQLQTGFTPSSDPPQSSILSPLSPTPLKHAPASKSEDDKIPPESQELTFVDQKFTKSAHAVVKMTSSDGYNWRKYGQKKVKSSEKSRSYFRCTHANCLAKKKVEHCQDGQVTEIIYRGQHTHEPPHRTNCLKESGSQPSGHLGVKKNLGTPKIEANVFEPCTYKKEKDSCSDTAKLHCSSDSDENPYTNAEVHISDEPNPKRRPCENIVTCSPAPFKTVKEPKTVVRRACNSGLVNDGYRWRKYGQKNVKGNPNPRSYYKCTNMGCPVRKHVEKASEDSRAVIITYEGKHNHDPPTKKGGETPATMPTTIPDLAPAATLLMAAEIASDEQMQISRSSLDKKAPTKRTPEDTGEAALESAETLLSIRCNTTSGKVSKADNSNVIQRPLFNGNRSAVSVHNS